MIAAEFTTLYDINPDYSAAVNLVRKENGYDTGVLYAMKSVPLPAEKRVLQRERDILSYCVLNPSPFVQTMHYAFQSTAPDAAHLVTEIYPGGSLETVMDERNGVRFHDNEGRFYIAEVVCAVEYLHANMIVHADVKMANVFVKSNGHVVLGDFDCASKLDSVNDHVSGVKGTSKYMAPEVPSERFSFPVDVWCIGMLAVDLMVEDPRTIHYDWPWEKVAGIVKRGFSLKPKVSAKVPQKLRSFISATLQRDPKNRPLVGDLKKLRFLNALESRWDDIVVGGQMTPPYVDQQRILFQAREYDGRVIKESLSEGEWLTRYRLKEDVKTSPPVQSSARGRSASIGDR